MEIARELNIAYQVYQRLENPRKANPTIKTLEKIARVYGRRIEVGFVVTPALSTTGVPRAAYVAEASNAVACERNRIFLLYSVD